MGQIMRQILTCLLIAFFIGSLHAVDYPALAICESDKDCLKGQAKCVRRECHCTDKYAFGDGKTKCEKWRSCIRVMYFDSCLVGARLDKGLKNSHCLINTNTKKTSCKCDEGYFGRPKKPGCRKAGMTSRGRYPCITDKNCPTYSKCFDRTLECYCREDLSGNGETCKPRNPKRCSRQSHCKSPKAICYDGICQCTGKFTGTGKYCREAEYCENSKCGHNMECVIDPFFPKSHTCRCEMGFRKSKKAGKCVECRKNDHCSNKRYAICVNEKCVCREDLVLGKTRCEAAPLHKCKTDKDCNSRAKCDEGKCICQGKTVGNGKYCRDSKPCPKDFKCGVKGTCLKDPLMPSVPPVCRCDKGYVKDQKKKCVECQKNKDCAASSTCVKAVCKCKDELIKEGKNCKPAPLHPCAQDNDCHEKAQCILGKCHCGEKKTGNGKFCRDSLPCPAEHKCGNQSECVVDPLFPNKPECKCREGTVKTSTDGKCEVVTGCAKKNLICPSDKICGQLVDGSYDCVCHKGYEMREGNSICQDIDECRDTAICSANSVCKNLVGGYDCKCNTGYRKTTADKNICEDWDECYELDNPCGTGEICENQQGTYTCLCDKGYVKMVGRCIKEKLSKNESTTIRTKQPTVNKNTDRPGFPFLFGSGHSLHVIGRLGVLILGLLGGLAFIA